ncbi:MAG: lytic transglycosylase domain-containing protein [Methylovirgula sp.]
MAKTGGTARFQIRPEGRRILLQALSVAALLLATFTSSRSWAEDSDDSMICEREMTRAAKKFDVPLGVLYAVALTETGRRGSLHPFALNIAGPSYFPTSLEDALERFDAAHRAGIKLIDIGCMQINQYYHGSHFRSVADMFDPHANVEYAAQYLKDLRVREGSWTLAAARYHAGPDNNPAQKQYVCAVIANMVASGFGKWTPTARDFCQ